MQAEQTELHKLIDEAYGTIIERLAERQEGKQHADRESLTGQDQSCSEKDDDDIDQSGEEGLDERHRNLILADGDAGIGQIGAEIAPCVSRSASRPISLIVVAARTDSKRCDCSLARARIFSSIRCRMPGKSANTSTKCRRMENTTIPAS
jgi:hypothetical protein